MQTIIYYLGKINRFVSMKFRVVTRNNRNMDSVQRKRYGGNDCIMVSGTYPSITIDIADEVKEQGNGWNLNKTVSMNKFSSYRFTTRGEELLSKMKKIEDLYVYDNGKLTVNKEIAWKIRVTVQMDYGKVVMLLPVVIRDEEDGQLYEGISFMINEIGNYALITYEEFSYMVHYIKHFDFDILAMQLINTGLLIRGGNGGKELLKAIPSVNTYMTVEQPPQEDYAVSTEVVEKTEIPNI